MSMELVNTLLKDLISLLHGYSGFLPHEVLARLLGLSLGNHVCSHLKKLIHEVQIQTRNS